MTTKAVNKLMDKYLEGKTSPDEERRLALEVNRPDAPAEWQVISDMLGDLTLSEAMYENTLARRRRRNVNLWMGWAAAACIAFMVVSGYFERQKFQREKEAEAALAQNTPVVVVPAPKEVLHEVTETAPVEAVAYTPKASPKSVKRVSAPVMEEEKVEMIEEEPPMQMPEATEAELAQVEKNYRMWQLRQAIFDEKIELEIATEKLNRRYEEYLAANKDNIEI
ncbi:MAG: hypothetical protein IJ635_01890 [Bacteroidaceae bacterium]|nr:hypothetical protein [Bacteroidaceae bacterium]